MFLAAVRLTLDVAALGAVRAKKQVLRRVVDRVKARFSVAVTELPDEGDRAAVGFAVLAPTQKLAREQLDRLLHFVEEMSVAPIGSADIELTRFGDASREEDDDTAELAIPKGERTLAEAEGLGAWENRPPAPLPTAPGRGQQAPRPSAGGLPLSLEEARARARSLRKPRDWEQPPPHRRNTKDG